MTKCNPLKISEMEGLKCILPEDLIPLVHKGTNRAVTIAQLVQQILGLVGNDPNMLKIACEAKSMALEAVTNSEQALQKACAALSISEKLQSMIASMDTRLNGLEQDVFVLKKLANDFAELSRQLTYLSGEVEKLKNQSLEIRSSEQNGFLTYVLYRDNVAIGSPILVPTKMSQLDNDMGFVTEIPPIPSKISDLEDDSDFVKESQLKGIDFIGGRFTNTLYSPLNANQITVNVPTKVSDLDNDLGFITGGGATELNGLSDVNLLSPVQGDVLYYDGTSWKNAGLSDLVQNIINQVVPTLITNAINNTVPGMIEAAQLWTRNSSTNTLSPKTAGDNIDTTGAIYSGSETWQAQS